MHQPQPLLSRRTLGRSAVWHVAGQVGPAIVGFVTVPATIKGYGEERFGLLALAWMVIGYFSLFDFGLGRAVTRMVAPQLASSDRHELRESVWTAWWLLAALGAAGALLAMNAVPWIVHRVLRGSIAMREEALTSFRLLAFSIPAIVLMAGFKGVLERIATSSFARNAAIVGFAPR